MPDSVELTDLEVIARFSLAVRSATADRAEVIAALRADLARLEGGRRATAPTRAAAPAKVPARKSPANKAAKAPAKKPSRSR